MLIIQTLRPVSKFYDTNLIFDFGHNLYKFCMNYEPLLFCQTLSLAHVTSKLWIKVGSYKTFMRFRR